ncbi:1-phosphofructokinase family hexose kinase [Aliiroseovarius subalbicans]|uniref:1-phosphofructokinase family hexose kinase n=1 Tax=Aliiroseovarius subalbicans TaxID=2925840 RepID=UPI001F58A8CD|nr:1-phosphofructokinase family hexose kinase [Aliiroseovarius subalbicans]MCI2400399.1 1-phosphofructokinase family hexose kinase [Aliiroseovarius subalbicans]
MSDILTVTLNPALDMSSSVDHVRPEDKLRCDVPDLDPGGGGINVARAIKALGGKARAFVALAGYRGQQFAELLAEEGVEAVGFRIEGETRLSLAVIDRSDGQQFRFVMPGPKWSPEDAFRALETIRAVTPKGGYVVLSGSQPPGVPLHFPTQLAAVVDEAEARLVLDTSGAALKALMDVGSARQHVLRLDGAESDMLAGRPLTSLEEVAGFAQSLVHRGVAEVVVLALGAKGSILAQDGRCWHAVTPEVPVKSKVGAGDSFVGAFTLALSCGADWDQALAQGVVAASAAVMSDASNLCRPGDVAALSDQVNLRLL